MTDRNAITVKVHLDVDLDGEQIMRILEMPASMTTLGDKRAPGGLHIHLSLDGRKLAQALLPHIAEVVRHRQGLRLQ